MRRVPFLLLLVLTGAFNVRLDFFEVRRQDNDIEVSWQTNVEEDVHRYELFRKTSYSGEYMQVRTFNPHGAGQAYQFTDDEVYKTASESVDYRLDVVYSNGVRQQLAARQVDYVPTAVRRTWGSIKAMFQ